MRGLGVVFAMLTLAGCRPLRDAFTAHPEVAGTAAGQMLTVERLAELAGAATNVPLRPQVLTALTTVYLDYAVFALALARGRDMDDSAFVLGANWPGVTQSRWDRFHERLVAARATLTRDQTDSAYRAGEIRLFQHILISLPASAAADVERQKRQQAQGVLRQVETRRGANFAEVAGRYSEDPGSKSRGGYLAAGGRGQFVPAFDTVAWHLPPGAMTGLVRSPFGFHIIRRPPLEEVRDTFRAGLVNTLRDRFDSLYVDSLVKQRRLKVASGAPALVRQAVQRLVPALDDRRTLATYRGGALHVADLARWLFALDPREVNGLTLATDSQLQDFIRRLGQRSLLLGEIDSAGVELTADDWREIKTAHDSTLAILRHRLALSPALLADSAATDQERAALAMGHVNDYLRRALRQETGFLPVPPFLALALRPGQAWAINEAGIARALERAQQIRARADSAAPPGGTGLRRAPGPAPVPPSDTAKR